jgi:metal-dependent HD superfamily phosphatase/phosphodiesterase
LWYNVSAMNNFNIPTRHNHKLATIVKRINADEELWQLWRCANMNATDRSGITDHGEIHIRVVANAALKMLRLLTDAEIQSSIETDYAMTREDAEVVVVLAACMHDLGISIHRDDHEQYSLFLARGKLPAFLEGLYDVRERTIMMSEILHAMIAHRWDVRCLTLEAGVLKVADALDMTEGRSRIPFEAGSTSIHSVSAAAITNVELKRGEERPIRVEITMSNSAGVFQVDELLKRKLKNSSIASYVEVMARVAGEGAEGEAERRLLGVFTL